MSELTDNQLTQRAIDSQAVTVVEHCYTNLAGEFWVGTIFYCEKTATYYDAEAGKPFSTELRSMLHGHVIMEAPDV